MNLDELQNKLIAAARLQPPDERVPYAYEKRIQALIKTRAVPDRWVVWSSGLWRAAISCMILVVVLGAASLLAPTTATATAGNGQDLSQDFENTMLASADQSDYSTP